MKNSQMYIPVNTRYDGCNQKGCAGGSGGVCEDPPGQMSGIPFFLNGATGRTFESGGRPAQNCLGSIN